MAGGLSDRGVPLLHGRENAPAILPGRPLLDRLADRDSPRRNVFLFLFVLDEVGRAGGVPKAGCDAHYLASRCSTCMRDLAGRVVVSCGYMVQAFRGPQGPGACGVGSRGTCRSRPGQNRRRLPRCRVSAAKRARDQPERGGSPRGHQLGHLSRIVNGLRDLSPGVLKRLHGVLFQRARLEVRVVPTEVKVVGWRKDLRRRRGAPPRDRCMGIFSFVREVAGLPSRERARRPLQHIIDC